MTLEERFWSKVEKTDACWLWKGAKTSGGYGQLFKKKIAGRSWKYVAHRLSYEMHIGPIPEGLQLDHLCRVHACVNPAHLEPVTQKENGLRGISIFAENARKTHCSKGHPYSGENLVKRQKGRQCRTCNREYDRLKARERYLSQKARGLRDVYWQNRKAKLDANRRHQQAI